MNFLEIDLEPHADPEDKQILNWLTSENSDIYLYSGPMLEGYVDGIIDHLERFKCRENVIFQVATYGGDADAAYRLARYLKMNYGNLRLMVTGFCKSAGTLLALGANEIVMAPRGEFGPLDVQLFDPDEFLHRSSGLATTQALSYLGNQAFETFESVFLNLRNRSGGNITTKTAAEIATSIAVGLYSGITEKVEPSRVGEMQRSMDIAVKYGERLCGDPKLVATLAKGYPSHSFIIDFKEAQVLFPSIRKLDRNESLFAKNIRTICISEFKEDYTRFQSEEGVFAFFKPAKKNESNGKKSSNLNGTGAKAVRSRSQKAAAAPNGRRAGKELQKQQSRTFAE